MSTKFCAYESGCPSPLRMIGYIKRVGGHTTSVIFFLVLGLLVLSHVQYDFFNYRSQAGGLILPSSQTCDCKSFSFSPQPSDTFHDIIRIHLQPPDQPKLNFSDTSLRSTISWPASPVVVPAVYDEYDRTIPPWLLRWPVWIYQRRDQNLPLFCPNFGNEGGVYLQFIVDFYDNLPEKVVFIQARPEEHDNRWEDIVRCIKPEVDFTTLAPWMPINRSSDYWEEAIREEVGTCWTNAAQAFHKEYNKGEAMSAYAYQMYVVSRSLIRRQSLLEYKRAYNIITARDDACHVEGISWDKEGNVILPANTTKSPNVKSTQGGVMEHLFHWLVGGQPLTMNTNRPNFFCDTCIGKSQCPNSPCPW